MFSFHQEALNKKGKTGTAGAGGLQDISRDKDRIPGFKALKTWGSLRESL